MLVKTGLLVISNPNQMSKVFSQARKRVKSMLYVQLMTASLEHYGPFKYSWPSYSSTIRNIYSQAAKDCCHLDVRVLLSGLKYCNVKPIQTMNAIDLVIFDRKHNQIDIEKFIKENITNVNNDCNVVTIACEADSQFAFEKQDEKHFKHVVLGGTFDRIHHAHKVLLSETALYSGEKVTVGVTEESMLATKTLWELAEPIETRLKNVEEFLKDICSELEYNVVPINDPLGPTKSDPSMDLLVVSAETLKGGQKVNEVRKANNLSEVQVLSVDLLDEPNPEANEETKISSSTARMRLLGQLMRPVTSNLPRKPYIVGLTGGIASGKSGVAQKLQELGAQVINCDLVGHQMYVPGTECYKKIVAEFGNTTIVPETQEINRKELGAIVFSDKVKLDKLNQLVWPAIANHVHELIRSSESDVIVVEAAILLSAGWQNLCHEVWTTLVPTEEAVQRLKTRNHLTHEQAMSRIQSQPNNKYYVNNAHVVFCSLWSVEYTHGQVDRAWNALLQRISNETKVDSSKY